MPSRAEFRGVFPNVDGQVTLLVAVVNVETGTEDLASIAVPATKTPDEAQAIAASLGAELVKAADANEKILAPFADLNARIKGGEKIILAATPDGA